MPAHRPILATPRTGVVITRNLIKATSALALLAAVAIGATIRAAMAKMSPMAAIPPAATGVLAEAVAAAAGVAAEAAVAIGVAAAVAVAIGAAEVAVAGRRLVSPRYFPLCFRPGFSKNIFNVTDAGNTKKAGSRCQRSAPSAIS